MAVAAALAAPRALPAQERPAPPATAPATSPATRDDAAALQSVGQSIPELVATLTQATSTRENRLEAARRLVARQSEEARRALRQAVVEANPDVRLAALRAIADDPNPSVELLDDLLSLVAGDNIALVSAAAEALGAYKGNTRVIDTMIRIANESKRPVALRISIVRILGRFIDQRAATALVQIGTTATESDLVTAACNALIEMTTLESNGHDPSAWAEWQKQNGNLPAAEWREEIYRAQQRRQDRLHHRADETMEGMEQVFQELYKATAADERPRTMMRFLRSASPNVRLVGAKIAGDIAQRAPGQITPEIQDRLLELVADSDAGVRLSTIDALTNINVAPEPALSALLPQLAVEANSDVKAAIARKLANVKGVRQVPQLNALLDDGAPDVVREAARALRQRVPDFTKTDAELLNTTTEKLRSTIDRLKKRPVFQDARVAAGEALAAFADVRNLRFALGLLNSNEPPEIRAVALRILGELGPQASDSIFRAIANERVPRVRAEGLRALGRTRSFEQSRFIVSQMGPDNDPEVRSAARAAYLELLPAAGAGQLAGEAQYWKNVGDHAMRVEVLKQLVKELDGAKQANEAAIQRQNIGDEYLNFLQRPGDAVPYLQAAVNYHRSVGAQRVVTDTPINQLVNAMLQSRQYLPLTRFVSDLAGKSSPQEAVRYQRELGAKVRNQVDALVEKKDYDDALLLLNAALATDSPFQEMYGEEFTQKKSEIGLLRSRNNP